MKKNPESLFLNYGELCSHGQTEIRQDALKILTEGIMEGDPGKGTLRALRLEGDILYVNGSPFLLSEIDNIYVIGSGKGAFPIAEALETILGNHINEGVIVVKKGEKRRLKRISVIEAGHPIPDESSILGAKCIMNLLEKLGEKDLVFAAITGGCSALTTLPAEGINLHEVGKLTDLLLKSGAVIQEINAVRKHICMIKGGRLAKHFFPAQAFTLTLNTAPEGMPWPDMCLPDPSTFQDAIDVLNRYDIWEETPDSIKTYLQKGLDSPEMETPKSLEGIRHEIISVADPWSMCEITALKAKSLGYSPFILGVKLEGEARELGCFFAGIAKEIVSNARPFAAPCAIISGGETTVTITGKTGAGGPNQETVLGFANNFRNKSCRVICASIDSDGTDGPTDIAGGIVDGETLERVQALGLRIDTFLKYHNSSELLKKLGDALVTGHTGTNLMNLRLILVK